MENIISKDKDVNVNNKNNNDMGLKWGLLKQVIN
jgi:hypothetical protein